MDYMHSYPLVLSGFHISKLAGAPLGKITISLDLGLTHSEVTVNDSEFIFPDGQSIDRKKINKIAHKKENEKCYLVEDNSLNYIYSFENNNTYRLYESHIDWPPTLWINGSVMHTVSVSKPTDEAGLKVESLGNINGRVLDTCFGLGYSAIKLIEAGADEVNTYDISESAIEIAKVNPWSRKIFEDKRINLTNEDIYEAAKSTSDESFDLILHDPPNIKMSGDLYSLDFYKEMYRILKKGGKLYHFVGSGRIEKGSANYSVGVSNRLAEAGFKNIKKAYRGFTAIK